MSKDFTYAIKSIPFDENYIPADSTRITTNFANLARGETRQQNLRNVIAMVNNRFNAIASWDNPKADRYSVDMEIISVDIDVAGDGKMFPTIETLKTYVNDHHNNTRTEGLLGNNFSSYVRDYDFSVRLLDHIKANDGKFGIPDKYGVLHGQLFKHFIYSDAYKAHFKNTPVICLSVSDSKIYTRTSNHHPILGFEYTPNETSLTEGYFKEMGLNVRYFMPPHSNAPFAFYFFGDLLTDYSNIELISTLSVMETFQRVYRPEIYNANAAAGHVFQPSLKNPDHSLTQIVYDREERSRLAVQQGKYAEEHFIKPYQEILDEWSANCKL